MIKILQKIVKFQPQVKKIKLTFKNQNVIKLLLWKIIYNKVLILKVYGFKVDRILQFKRGFKVIKVSMIKNQHYSSLYSMIFQSQKLSRVTLISRSRIRVKIKMKKKSCKKQLLTANSLISKLRSRRFYILLTRPRCTKPKEPQTNKSSAQLAAQLTTQTTT